MVTAKSAGGIVAFNVCYYFPATKGYLVYCSFNGTVTFRQTGTTPNSTTFTPSIGTYVGMLFSDNSFSTFID